MIQKGLCEMSAEILLVLIFIILLPTLSFADEPVSSSSESGGITDHLMIQVLNASAAYELFVSGFGLPIAWNLSDYQIFTSGGVSLGNVNVELLESSAKSKEDGIFPKTNGIIGIAFQPAESLNRSLTLLDQKQIQYGAPEPFTVDMHGSPMTLWTNVNFDGFMPGTQVFYCNYSFDETKQRARLTSELSTIGGGPLGIIGLTGIGINYSNESVRSNWERFLPLVHESTPDLLDGGGGVKIRMIPSDQDSIASIIIQVRSLQQTESVLHRMGVPYTVRDGSLFMESEKIPGVEISFIQ